MNKPLLLTIVLLAFAGAAGPSMASASVPGAAIHTSPAEAARLSDPVVVAAAKDPALPAPEATLSTPTLPPASASAKGSDVEVNDTTSFPNRIQGKIIVEFNDSVDQTYACSGTMVDSVQQNVVFTAGHCVYDNDTNAFPSAMVFIPGYNNGIEPFGEIPVNFAHTTNGWHDREDFDYDMGAVQLEGTPEATLGARGIAFDMSTKNRKFKIYGYPAEPAPYYDGERLIRCDASFKGRDGKEALAPMAGGPCFMQQGASGGGWITGGRYLNSLTSYIYCDSDPKSCGLDFGPYFSNQARSLYKTVATSQVPTVKFVKAPPKVVRHKSVKFRLGGSGTTPIRNFTCKLDANPYRACFPLTRITRLTNGRHTLKVYSLDQTGHRSDTFVTASFRVKAPR